MSSKPTSRNPLLESCSPTNRSRRLRSRELYRTDISQAGNHVRLNDEKSADGSKSVRTVGPIQPASLATMVSADAIRCHTNITVYLFSFVNFDPSRVKLYINPFWSRMKPTIGWFILDVSSVVPAPNVTTATEPSTPTFQPSLF